MTIPLYLIATMVFGTADGPASGRPVDEGLAACFRYSDTQPLPEPPVAESAPEPTPVFGSAESRWWTVGAGVAHDFNGSTDTDLSLAYSYFLAKDVEFAAEIDAWYFNQTGDNTFGTSLSMVFRWHFVNTGPWTVYADAGVGFLVAADEVPDGGTSFDLMPRAGMGFTRELGDDGVRLQMGVQWHHISNARIHGDQNNPARDQPMIYAGIIFPF